MAAPSVSDREAGRKVAYITPERLAAVVPQASWERLLGLIATGHTATESINALELDPVAVEGMIRGDPLKHRAWREAHIAADRRHWSVEVLESIATDIATNPGTPLESICALYGKTAVQYLLLVRRDPAIKEMYEEARAIAAEVESDQLRGIADDSDGDETSEGKPNMAAVQRSKLRVETRMTLMAANNRKFVTKPGSMANDTKVNVTVNLDHANRLESARARVRKAQTVEDAQIIEGQSISIEQPTDAGDTSWAD